jgi:UDP-glucuronate 4-epimerase
MTTMKERSCLVTGAAGFIGSHLCDMLVASGHRVIGIDNFDPYYDQALKRDNIADLLQDPLFTFIEGDIRDHALVSGSVAEYSCSTIIHLAARAGVRGSVAEPLMYTELNVDGTVALLEVAAKRGVERFIFGSSSSVYGATNDVPFTEGQDITRPVSAYAASKVAGEAYSHVFHSLYHVPVVCLRFFTVYGPRQRPDLAINKFCRLMLEGKPIPVYGDGRSSRDFTYVGDIVRGIGAALDAPELGNPDTFEIINLGNDSPVTVLELVEVIEEVLGRKAEIDWHPPSPGDMPRTWACIDKARRLLKWEPQVSLAEGIGNFVNWCEGATQPCP